MKPETQALWNKLPPVPSWMEDMIFEKGQKTGSRFFGLPTLASDLDILLLSKSPLQWNNLMTEGYGVYTGGHYRGEGFDSLYVKLRSRSYPVNLLIFTDEQELQVWIDATKVMRKWKMTDPMLRKYLSHKRQRLDMFEFVKDRIRETR